MKLEISISPLILLMLSAFVFRSKISKKNNNIFFYIKLKNLQKKFNLLQLCRCFFYFILFFCFSYFIFLGVQASVCACRLFCGCTNGCVRTHMCMQIRSRNSKGKTWTCSCWMKVLQRSWRWFTDTQVLLHARKIIFHFTIFFPTFWDPFYVNYSEVQSSPSCYITAYGVKNIF